MNKHLHGWKFVSYTQHGRGGVSIEMEKRMSSKKGRYEIFRGSDDLWFFNRIAGNGEVEHPSEGYVSRGNAVRAIGTCMEDTSHYVIEDREEPEKGCNEPHMMKNPSATDERRY